MSRTERPPESFEETFETLRERARKRYGKVPAELIAAQVVASTTTGDWALKSAALDALHRRRRFGERDGLRVVKRPKRVFGIYATGAPHADLRPYQTLLASLVPLRGSCGCADFVRSSLGLCKHLLAVLDDVCSTAKRVDAAEREQARGSAFPIGVVWWDPSIPLAGPLDRLLGLRIAVRGRVPAGWVEVREKLRGSRSDAESVVQRGMEDLRAWRLLSATARALEPPGGATLCALDAKPLRDIGERLALLRRLIKGRMPCEPAAQALVVEETARAERFAEARRSAERSLPKLASLKRKLYAYQREGVERFLRSGRLLLADDMGLGKTTQAVAACHGLFHAGVVKRGVLVVPAALKPQWLREWEDTTDVPASVVDGAPADRAAQYRRLKRGFLIIGYEQLLRDFEQVRAIEPDMVVLDEAQRIKNWATKSATYVKALAPRFRLVLTGTPMENRLEELASILDWVDDVALAPKWRLDPWHTYAGGDAASGSAGARNLDTLRTRLEPCLVRRRRQEVLKQLPSRTDTRVPVPMTEQQIARHDELNQPIAAMVARAARRPLTQPEFLKLMQMLTVQRIISNGLGQLQFDDLWPTYEGARPDDALIEGLFAPKLFEFRRLIEEIALAQERKIVVFSQWRRMLRLAAWSVRDILGDAGASAVFFTGAESQAQRTRSIVDFHDEPGTRVMFLSDAGGVGLNLQRAASACINLELPWNPAVLEQRIGRIYRLGQKRPIDVYNLVSEYGIESRIAAIVSNKRALFSGLFDGTSDSVRFDGHASFLRDVERLVAPESPLAPAALAALPPLDSDSSVDDVEDRVFDSGSPKGDAIVRRDSAPDPREPQAPPATTAAIGPAALLSSVRVRRTEGGGVSIEAPPEVAASLMALFDGMARLMAQAAAPQDGA